MGMVIPIIMIIASAAASTCAVMVALSTLYVISIIAAVVSVVATCAAIYFYIQGDIKNSMLFAGIGIAAGVGGIYSAYVSEAATAAALLSEGTASSITAAGSIYASTTMQIVAYAQSVYATFGGFLEAIHFKAIMAVHQIAYVLSADYRKVVDDIYGQIRQVSEALGYGADFMQLILRDTRNLVLDVSSSIGKPYDLSEITWMNTFGGFMKGFADKAMSYRNNPSAFLWDIDEMIVKSGIDSKAYTVQTMLAATERALEGVKLLGENVTMVRNDVIRFVGDLPLVLRSQIEPAIRKVTDDLDKFMKLSYDPTMKVIDKAFKIMGDDLGATKIKAQALTDRLIFAGNYLKEIDQLDPKTRKEQEAIISEIAGRNLIEGFSAFETLTEEEIKKAEGETGPEEREFPTYEAPPEEVKTPGAPPEIKKEDRKSPFVGDY